MKIRKLLLVLAVTVAVVGVVVVASNRDDGRGPSDGASGETPTPGTTPTSTVSGGTGETDATATVTASPGASPGVPAASPTGVPQDSLPADFAVGKFKERHPDDPRPDECPVFRNGESCEILFTGSYRLTNHDFALIDLGAYEDGSPTRVSGGSIKVGRGINRWYMVYNYGISATKTVQFKIKLLTEGGVLLYEHPMRILELDE